MIFSICLLVKHLFDNMCKLQILLNCQPRKPHLKHFDHIKLPHKMKLRTCIQISESLINFYLQIAS